MILNTIPSNPVTSYAPSYGGKTTDIENKPGKTSEESQNQQELSEEEEKQVKDLKKRDKEVRAHEMAHVAAGGQYVQGGAQFDYQTGPDGKRYAVGGEVSIDTSPIKGDPQATIQKMQQVQKAALAPAQPSAQDRAVASKAAQEQTKARMELREQKQEEAKESSASGHGARHISYTSSGIAVPASPTGQSFTVDLIA